MISTLQLRNDLDANTALLDQKLYSFTEEQYNTPRADGGWSAGQIVAHLLKLEQRVLEVINGETHAADKHYDEQVSVIESVYGNYDRKLEAGEPIKPDAGVTVWDKNNQLLKLTDLRNNIKQVLETKPANEVCVSYRHEMFGELTRYEWGYLVIYHCERHMHQIDGLDKQLNVWDI
ncbi:MAG: DinB family protein [Sphingobacteriales bacterium]|nr:MAG: DinB family protein [Sphingobacteriales bacterium]